MFYLHLMVIFLGLTLLPSKGICKSQVPNSVQRISTNAEHIFRFVKPFIPKDPILLECGGYNGNDTALMARAWPKGTIHTFEPIPELFNILSQNTNPYSNVKKYQLALADRTGRLTFYFSDFNNSGTPSGSSSLLPPKDHVKFDHWVTFNGTIEVEAMSLDDWAAQAGIDHIDFMWLDMQGFELNMLKASKLAKKTKVIYLEVEFIEAYAGQYLYPDIKKWMEENGFCLIALDFDEKIGLAGDQMIKPGTNLPYYGNAIFLNVLDNQND